MKYLTLVKATVLTLLKKIKKKKQKRKYRRKSKIFHRISLKTSAFLHLTFGQLKSLGKRVKYSALILNDFTASTLKLFFLTSAAQQNSLKL